MADDLSTYWKDLPSRETPLDARTLNEWGALVEERADDARGAAVTAAAARDEAISHVDLIATPALEQVAAYIRGVGGQAVQDALTERSASTNAATFGAAGDGAADDTTALQAALNATAAAGVLYLPPGQYRTTGPLNWPSGVTIEGRGLASLVVTGNYSALTVGPGAADGWIRGVRFVGTMPTTGVATKAAQCGINIDATAAQRATGMRVENCSFEGLEYIALRAKHAYRLRVTGCTFDNYGYAGVGMYSPSDTEVQGNRFAGTGALPSYASNSYAAFASIYEPDGDIGGPSNPRPSDVTFISNTVRNQQWEGLDTHAGQRISFIGNVFVDCPGNAIACVGIDTASPLGCVDITIANNEITGPSGPQGVARAGIILRGQSSATPGAERCTGTITGNVMKWVGDADSTVSGGILVANGQGVVVASNVIIEPRSNGIIAQDSIGTVIQGNTVRDVWKTAGTSSGFTTTLVADAVADTTLIGNRLLRGHLTPGAHIPAGASINLAGYHGTNSPGVTVYQEGNFFPPGTAFPGAVAHIRSGTRGTREADGTAPPTTGAWATGDRIKNAAPAAGGAIGWVCISGGTPGNWKSYGAISS